MVKQKLGELEVLGYSMGGEESVVVVPEFNVAFDFGRGPRELMAIDNVCLSHGHMDHAAGIAYYFSQRHFLGISPGCAIMHPSLVRPVERLLRAWADIEGHPSPARLIGLEPDQDHVLRRGLIVRAFPVAHAPPALGFAVIEVRHKLKPEYGNLSGPQLVELKKKGVEIEYRLEVPRVAYCGDTAAGTFLDRNDVRNSEVLIIECTFFDEDHVHRARAGRHLHVQDLREALSGLNCKHILLIHMTRRTPLIECKKLLAKFLGAEGLQRIRILMDRPRGRTTLNRRSCRAAAAAGRMRA